MNTLVGTGRLTRFILRRERARLSAWVGVLALVPVATASAFMTLYPDEVSRQALANTVASSPALTALLGPLHSSSIGGLTVWRSATIAAFLVAILAILTLVRHTREEEETGRRELLGSTVMGRHAPLAAALLVMMGAGVVLGAMLSLGLIMVGLPAAGSVAFGLALAGTSFVFAGVGAVAAQLTEGAGAARGIGVGVAGGLFLIRMIADSGVGEFDWLSWLSPIGWVSQMRPFAGEVWWVLAFWLALAAVLVGVAAVIADRRDVGAGAFRPRPGPSTAGRGLGSALGLAWRIHRGSVLGWTFGLAILGAVYGATADSVGDMLDGNPQLAEILEQLGGEQSLVDGFFVAALGIIALITAAYGIRAVLRIRVEEEALRAEPVLATSTPRLEWATSHLFFGVMTPVLILSIAGSLAGAAYGAITGDVGEQTARALSAALVHVPAVWVVVGVTMALVGLAPHRTGLSWGFLNACLILGQLGRILQFPQWSLNLSPFTHVPQFPAEKLDLLPLVALLVVAAVLVAAGLAGFRRRDIRN